MPPTGFCRQWLASDQDCKKAFIKGIIIQQLLCFFVCDMVSAGHRRITLSAVTLRAAHVAGRHYSSRRDDQFDAILQALTGIL